MDLSAVPNLRPPPSIDEPSFHDPDYVRASTWLARRPDEPRAIVLGAPYGGASISGARCDLSPAAIRGALSRFSVWSSEHAVSLESLPVLDAGDVEPGGSVEETQERIAAAVEAVRAKSAVPIVLLGGDNSVTVGGARGVSADALLTFDAHHDCRDPSRGATNGSPVRQLVEGGLTTVVQVGIGAFANSEANARWALDHKVHWINASRVHDEGIGRALDGALRLIGHASRIWVDVDMDVLARAYAPGAPASMPGGLVPNDLHTALYRLGRDPAVAGIDITEVDPTMDVAEITVRTAASVVLSFLAGVASR